MRQLVLLIFAVLIGGCSGVFSVVPVGTQPKNIEATQGEWQGTWMHPDGALMVRVINAALGELEVGWVDEGGGALKYERVTMVLRDAGDWTFASFKPRGEEGEKQYAWARVRKEERQVILWRPNEDKFKVLVEEGRLPGMVDGSVVVLDTLAPEHLDLIRSETHGVLFVWDKPFVLLKAGK